MELLRKYGGTALDLVLTTLVRLMPVRVRPAAKAVAAFLSAAGASALLAYLTDQVLTGAEIGYAVGVGLTALGVVYRVPNLDKKPADPGP